MMISEYQVSITLEICIAMGKHEEILTCKCGDNRICYTCGYGMGSLPCRCQNTKLSFCDTAEKVMEDCNDASEKLASL